MSEERIVAALRALAESSGDMEASPEVEARLLQAFRRRLSARRWKRAAVLATAAAAAVAGIVIFSGGRQRQEPPPVVAAIEPSVREAPPPVEADPVVAKPAHRPTRVRQALPREVLTEFFPLIDVAPPFGRGELVRLMVPASTMLTVGLPVREDRLADPVQADVLIGEEGLPRAIRFVKIQQ